MEIARLPPARTLNLALQGGGSHGAFTWGVLDALLGDGRLSFEGLSGTSAGALNAVALASGWARAEASGTDPRQGAREALERLWTEVAGWGAIGDFQRKLAETLWGGFAAEFAPTNFMTTALRGWLSPYQANPLDINPLRDLVAREIDFGALAAHPRLKVFVSATQVATGRAVVFGGPRLTAEAVMASTCLPMLFRAVEIEGQAYWDGGYSLNPALSPLIGGCACSDILLVQINPLSRPDTPRSASEILDRANELTFNASLLAQMRSIDFVNRLLATGALGAQHGRPIRIHRIDGGPALAAYPGSSRTRPDGTLIRELFAMGQEAARTWLASHWEHVGHRSTVDIVRDYGDESGLSLPRAEAGASRGRLGPWLARLLGRKPRG